MDSELFAHFSDAQKDTFVQKALSEARMLVESPDHIDYAIGDQHMTGEQKQSVATQQAHLVLNDEQLSDVIHRHLASHINRINPLSAETPPFVYYIPTDPASTRIMMDAIKSGDMRDGVNQARQWLAKSGSDLDSLFYPSATDIRNQLISDLVVQSVIDTEENGLSKVRALASGIHTVLIHEAVSALKKVMSFHELDTDNMCPDWGADRLQEYLGHVRDNINRSPNETSYVMGVLLTPQEAKLEAEKIPDLEFSSNAVAEKARGFAHTVREVLIPEKANLLLMDKEMNVILHRENGCDLQVDTAALQRYYAACDVEINGHAPKGSAEANSLDPSNFIEASSDMRSLAR